MMRRVFRLMLIVLGSLFLVSPAQAQPLDQPSQNFFVEALLKGAYHHQPVLDYLEYRPSDGLLTKGVSRIVADPRFCLVGGAGTVPTEAEDLLTTAVNTLTGGMYQAIFLDPLTCGSGLVDVDGCAYNPTGDSYCDLMPTDQITVFLDCDMTGYGRPCYAAGAIGWVHGGAITGGVLLPGDLSAGTISSSSRGVFHEELGHILGAVHSYGDLGVMSRLNGGKPDEYAPFEIAAFVALHTVEPGTGLRDLIAMGIIDDTQSVLDEPPVIYRIDMALDYPPYRDYADNNHGAVGDKVYLKGQRMTMAFGVETGYGFGRGAGLRRLGYAPPIIRFGQVVTVPDLSQEFQGFGPGAINVFPLCAAGVLKVKIPPGAQAPLRLTVRGHEVTFSDFVVDGPAIPNPGRTPNAPSNLTCARGLGGTADLQWTPPTQYASGTPLNTNLVRTHVFRNGVQVGDRDPTDTTFHDPIVYDYWETSLYQVVLVDADPAQPHIIPQEGIPSAVCQLTARREGPEVTIFVIDRSHSMGAYLRADGTTRFEAMIGPLPSSQVPRAFAAVEEVFSAAIVPPRVAVYSFNSQYTINEVLIHPEGGSTFTSDRYVVEEVLREVRYRGPEEYTPLLDNICISAVDLLNEFQANVAGTATLRIFTDGEENFSIGVPDCPASCQSGQTPPDAVDWNLQCRPGTCPSAEFWDPPADCTPCQVDLFNQYCGQPVNFFVEYFGRYGPFSPLPPDAGFLMDLANATQGRFTWNVDSGDVTGGIPGDQIPVADAGEPASIECSGPGGTPFFLMGNAYDELPSAQLEFTWTGSFPEGGGVVNQLWSTVTLPMGSNFLQLTLSDEHQHSRPSQVQIDVSDSAPPSITNFQYAGPTCLWPPNHKYAVLRIGRDFQGSVADSCDPNASLVVTDVRSSQPDNTTGDGNTLNDIVAFPDRVCVRAERRGQVREGRVYSIEVRAIDAAGNQSEPFITQIRVAHDQGHHSDCRASGVELVDEDDPICSPQAETGTVQGSTGCHVGASHRTPTTPTALLLAAIMLLIWVRRRGRAVGEK